MDEWTVETLRAHFEEVLRLRDRELEERFHSVSKSVELAKEALHHRLAGLNELRQLVVDHDRRYATIERVAALENRLDAYEKRFEALAGERSGVAKGWGVLVAVAGMLAGLTGVAVAIWSATH